MKKNERIYQANFPKINDSPSFQKQKRKINMNRFIYNANKNHSLRDESNLPQKFSKRLNSNSSKEITLESLMNSSPKRYFHTFKESELFYNENEIFDENQNQNIMVQKSTNFNKKTPNNLLNTFVGDIYKTLKDENNKEKTVSTDKNQSLENIEFLKKIYKPRKQTKEKLKDLEKNVQKNRFVQRLERVVDNQNKNNSERNSNFRIKLDKNFSSYNNNEFPNKDNHQNNNDRYLDLCKKEEEKNLDKEEKKYCNSNLIKNKEGIKQNKTYKLIEGKTLENKSKKEIKPENNFKPQNNNAEKNNCNPFKNTENAIDNNENQILGAKQLNSFKISVNLTPTFHLNLNSTMQNEGLNQILEALKFKSNDIQISHPTNFLVQNNIENTTEKINSQPFTGKNPNFEVSHLYPEILKDHKQEIKFSECDPSFLEIVGMKPSLKFEEKNLEEENKKKDFITKSSIEDHIFSKRKTKESNETLNPNSLNSFHDIKKNNQMKMNELQFEKKKNLEKKGSFKNSLSSLEKNEENKTTKANANSSKKTRFEDSSILIKTSFENFTTKEKKTKLSNESEIEDLIENNKIESDAVFLKSIELKRNCELKSVCEDSSSIHSVETPSGSPKCHKYFNSLQPQITQSLKNIKLGVLNENDEEIIDLLSSQLQSTKNKRESSNHHSLELIRSLKNKHSEEEKEAMQLTSAIKADFKSKFYKFSNELKIPVIKRNSILKFLEKEKESQRKLSKKHDLKLASDIMIRKKATFLIITKMNFDFKKKNPLYWSSIKFQKKSIMHMNEFDRIHTRKNSIYRKNFDENKKKFSEKLGGFFKYHQNPFYDNHHINLKASKLINGKFAFFFEKTSINLSQILSNKAVKASFNEDENDSSMSNSYEDDEKVYKFKSRSDKDKYMIKISPPEIDNEMDLYHSLTHNFSPKKLTKSEKSPRSLTNQKFFDTEQQQIKKFLSNIKTLFIDLEQKCAKTLQIYNYKKHWKMFKTAFFTNLQIFITANLIEIMTIDFRDIQTTEKLSNYQKIEDLINERNINFTTSFNYLCPLNSHLIKSQEIWNTKYSEGFEIIAFDYKFEMNEKKEDKEELRKIIKCSEIEEDGDSPLLIWDLNSKLSLNMEEDFHVILDKREESQILFFDKEDDNEEFEQEKNYRRLKNGAKLEIISISFKNLENLFNYMNSLIIPFVSSLDFQSKEPFLIHFSLGHQLDMSTFVLDNKIQIKKWKAKKKFIEKSVIESKITRYEIKMLILHHELILKGSFEDFILIPNDELRNFAFEKQIKNIKDNEIMVANIGKTFFMSEQKPNAQKRTIIPQNDYIQLNEVGSYSTKIINDMKITFEEPLTCPIIKENKFFPNITQEEIKFSQKLEKSPLRSRKKSFTGVFNEDYISKNSELKKLQREKSKRNIFDNEEARNSFASNNLAPVRIFLNAPNQKKKIAEIPELVSQEDKDEENLKQRKHSILSRKSENAEIYNSDKDLMAPLSAYQKKKRTKILKLEKEKISNTNKEDLNNNNKKFPFVCDDEDNKFSQDKMERSSIFVKTLMLYEAQKKDLTIFEEMKWLVIHSKICDLQHLFKQYSIENIDQKDEKGNTLLMYAVMNDDLEMTNYLLSKTVNYDLQNNDGDSALHLAISYENDEITDLLLSIGVNQNLKNNFGKTPWDLTKK